MKQTAVEYYDKIVSDIFQEFIRDEITKTELIVKIHNSLYPALEMEKEQINDACYHGYYTEEMYDTRNYYNEIYSK